MNMRAVGYLLKVDPILKDKLSIIDKWGLGSSLLTLPFLFATGVITLAPRFSETSNFFYEKYNIRSKFLL